MAVRQPYRVDSNKFLGDKRLVCEPFEGRQMALKRSGPEPVFDLSDDLR